MLVRTLKRCSGHYNFAPGIELDIPAQDARELIRAGAVVSMEPEVAPEPKVKAETVEEKQPKRTTRKKKSGS